MKLTDRELMQQALEALRTLHDENMDYLTRNKLGGENNQCMVFARETITALRERLAREEQWQGLAADSTIQTVPAQGGLLPAQFGIRGGLAQDTQNKEQNR